MASVWALIIGLLLLAGVVAVVRAGGSFSAHVLLALALVVASGVVLAVTVHRCRGVFGGDLTGAALARSSYCSTLGFPAIPGSPVSLLLAVSLFGVPVLLAAVAATTRMDMRAWPRVLAGASTGGVLLVAVLLCIALARAADAIPAPGTSSVAAPGARVALSVVTGDGVVGAQDPRLFRTIDLTSDRDNALALLKAETRYLLTHGWTDPVVTADTVPDDQQESTRTSSANPEATVALDSRDHSRYLVMALIRTSNETNDAICLASSDSCTTDTTALTLLRRHRPIVSLTTATANRPPFIPEPGA